MSLAYLCVQILLSLPAGIPLFYSAIQRISCKAIMTFLAYLYINYYKHRQWFFNLTTKAF